MDDSSSDKKKMVDGSDLIVIATPLSSYEDVIWKIKNSLKNGVILTDVGSVKGNVINLIEKNIRRGNIKINNRKEKSSYKLNKNDFVVINDLNITPNINKKVSKTGIIPLILVLSKFRAIVGRMWWSGIA